ncbi:ABC transporter ATP-binding protein [Microbispora sp. H11081]|uniref:ABC transporter ATP-binding protein n=1 Tax=Microbispora sp. H11081 TaxID=2729107 RepID=UPI002016994B|nr:ABC transporter ATP-binding protein [Microbispora sp. H11081]
MGPSRGRGHDAHDGVTAPEVDSPVGMLLFSVRQAPGWTAALVMSSAAGSATALALPAALARSVDTVLAGERAGAALGGLAALLAVAMAAEVLGVWAGSAQGTAVELSLRRGLTRRLLRAGLAGRHRFAAGDVSSRMVAGAAEASGLVSTALSVAAAVVLSAGGLVALAVIDWRLAVVFTVCVPVAAVLVRRFVSEASQLMTRYQELQGALSARLVEAISGARTIRAAGTLDREVERVLAPLPDLTAVGRATWDAQCRTVWKVSLLGPLTQVAVLAAAGVGVADGRISPGSWIAVAGYVGIALGLLGVVDTLMGFAHVRAGTARIAEVLSLPPGAGGARTLPDGPGAITFRSVSVRVDGETLLDGVDVDIPPGVAVAVVGRSGAGKSTFAALAGGLLAPDRGEVLLDGVPPSELEPGSLRRAVAYAFERPALLGGTVHGTIAYASPEATREQVELAARRVSADDFVRRLPEGYDTPLDRAPLSGGEAQRLGLARAVVGERRVLILDDATSSLDTATEAQVTATLTRLLAGRTRIVVAHRASTAARADLVVWLENGRVRGTGPHELLWREPAYRAMFTTAGEFVKEPA